MLMLLLISILISVFQNASTVHAQTTSVVISEVYPATLSDESEWIELYNPTNAPIDISDWSLNDSLSVPSTINIIESEVLDPYSFFVIELTAPKLNNDGDKVVLKSADGVFVDEIQYTNAESGKSIAKLFVDSVAISDQITSQTPSKGLINDTQEAETTPSPTPTPSQTPIPYPFISIEAVNGCSNEDNKESATISTTANEIVLLDNWYFIDEQDNKISLDGYKLNTQETIEFNKHILNNSGDTIKLFNPRNEQVSSLESDPCATKNEEPTSQLTEPNTIPAVTPPPITDTPKPTIKSQTSNQINTELMQHKKLSQLLSKKIKLATELPPTEFIEHILHQKQVSKSGIVSVIIGGTLLVLSGLLL